MRRHKDLLAVLRANGMRITAGRRALLQFILDNRTRRIGLREIHAHMAELGQNERTSIYRNLMAFQRLGIIQAFKLANHGKTFQYVLDRRVPPFYICKSCGSARRGDPALFERLEAALQKVSGYSRANLSVVFYGTCRACSAKAAR